MKKLTDEEMDELLQFVDINEYYHDAIKRAWRGLFGADETPEEKARNEGWYPKAAGLLKANEPVILLEECKRKERLYESALTAKDEEIKRLKESAWTDQDMCLFGKYCDEKRGTYNIGYLFKEWTYGLRKKRKDGE